MTEGICSTPGCGTRVREGRFCSPCKSNLARIKDELDTDPLLLYHQRSDNPNRRMVDRKKKKPTVPSCCAPGCFEERVPPDPYCTRHQDFAGGD